MLPIAFNSPGEPDRALSDGPNMLSLSDVKPLLALLKELDLIVKGR